MEFTLLAAAATAILFVWIGSKLLSSEITPDHPTDRLIGAALGGVVVGRVTALIEAGVNVLTRPGDVIIIRGGIDTGWAAVAALAIVGWSLRRDLPLALDGLAPMALFGLGGWHAGCLWRGACLGTATDLPWAVTSPGTSVGRHPVELYAAAALLAAGWSISRRPRRPWIPTGTAIAMAGAIRLATQPLRLSIMGGPVGWYLAAVIVGLLVAAVGHRVIRTRPPSPSTMEM